MSTVEVRIKELESQLEKTKAALTESKRMSFRLHKLLARSREDKLYSMGEQLYAKVLQVMSEIWPNEDHNER